MSPQSPRPAPSRCPVCAAQLEIARLQCRSCETAIEGRFAFGALGTLTREQLQFVEVFVRNRGKIKDVEDELRISYPTVVGRLNEVVRALHGPEPDLRGQRQAEVLDALERGDISADEAAEQLRASRGESK